MQSRFDFQPTLEGPRVTVRPIVPGDWRGMFAAAGDPKVWQQHPANDRYTKTVFRAYFDQAVTCGKAFAFIDRKSSNIIGSSRYYGYDASASEVEIGWTFLAHAYWGGSYNREIKQLMLEHAFRYVDTVVFWVGQSNLRSRKAMEKIGGRLRDGIHIRLDTDLPHVIYAIGKNGPATLKDTD